MAYYQNYLESPLIIRWVLQILFKQGLDMYINTYIIKKDEAFSFQTLPMKIC